MYPTRDLALSTLFQCHSERYTREKQASLAYLRAKAIAKAYALTIEDIFRLSPKFWQLHTDPICVMDGAATTLLTIQLNLCAGTLSNYVKKQPYIYETLQKVVNFEYSGQFCLTEVGHGLDAFHIETTATLLENGQFELNTPSEQAAKHMPPTKPMGDKCVAVVFARALVNGEDHGIKPFLVPLNDGTNMYPGVICKCLPYRNGTKPINHSLTYFHKVLLPRSALLGTLEKAKDPKAAFFALIFRVVVGGLALGSIGIPVLQMSSYIAARYSLRRMVTDPTGNRVPIISFRTQKTPILVALAQSFVMKALHEAAVPLFQDHTLPLAFRHGVAIVAKVVMVQHAPKAALGLGDRCGAQGLFDHNHFSTLFEEMRGIAIAEGDTLGLSIKLASELLLGRYSLPPSVDPESLLARHEKGLFTELGKLLKTIGDHRSFDYDRHVLPDCLLLVQSIGHRMAYDAAVNAKVDQCLIDLYVASCVKLDSSWYAEHIGLGRQAQRELEANAVDAVFPHLESLLKRLEVEPYIKAPIVSEKRWNEFVNGLPTLVPPANDISQKYTISKL